MRGDFEIGYEAPRRDEADALYAAAFPEEDLTALVRALLALDRDAISVTARSHRALIGHGLLSLCGVESGGQAALLGPLAVSPGHQRQGVGGALISAGVERVRDAGASHVLVLGDPAYYARFGFEPEHRIKPAHAIPAAWEEAWRSLTLCPSPAEGRLFPPAPWDDPALWR